MTRPRLPILEIGLVTQSPLGCYYLEGWTFELTDESIPQVEYEGGDIFVHGWEIHDLLELAKESIRLSRDFSPADFLIDPHHNHPSTCPLPPDENPELN